MARSLDDSEEVKKKLWVSEDQPGELQYHASHSARWRWSPKWDEAKRILQEYFNFHFERYADETLMDIGAGTRSMLEWWEGRVKIAVEPLADRFANELNIRDLQKTMTHVHAVAAEEFLPEWEGKVDFVWSHNVLDHCWSWQKILDNIDRYLRPGGEFYIGTDANQPPKSGHPGIKLIEFWPKIEELGWKMKKTYWLKKGDPVWLRTIGLKGFKP